MVDVLLTFYLSFNNEKNNFFGFSVRAVLVFGQLMLRRRYLVIWRSLKLMFQLALYCLDIMLEFGTVISLIL